VRGEGAAAGGFEKAPSGPGGVDDENRAVRHPWRFDHVIPNHDGEDSEDWDAFYDRVGDARRTLLTFVALLEGRPAPHAEKWEPDLVL